MDEQLKSFIYHKNGWTDKVSPEVIKQASRNKNINGEKIIEVQFNFVRRKRKITV